MDACWLPWRSSEFITMATVSIILYKHNIRLKLQKSWPYWGWSKKTLLLKNFISCLIVCIISWVSFVYWILQFFDTGWVKHSSVWNIFSLTLYFLFLFSYRLLCFLNERNVIYYFVSNKNESNFIVRQTSIILVI